VGLCLVRVEYLLIGTIEIDSPQMSRLLSIVLALVGLFIFFVAIFSFDKRPSAETIRHNRKIDLLFRETSRFVDTFKDTARRLPDTSDYAYWQSHHPINMPGIYELEYFTKDIPEDAIRKFGKPDRDSYLLIYPRDGEWVEYYASWKKQSSLAFDERSYYITGSRWTDGAAFLLVALLFWFLAWKVWPTLTRRAI